MNRPYTETADLLTERVEIEVQNNKLKIVEQILGRLK